MTFAPKQRVWHPGFHASGQWTGLGTVSDGYEDDDTPESEPHNVQVHVVWDNGIGESYSAHELAPIETFCWTDQQDAEMMRRYNDSSAGLWRLPFEDGAICRPYDDQDREFDEANDVDPSKHEDDDQSLCAIDEDGMGIIGRRADAEFIVAAHRLVPAMMAEIERLHTELARRTP